MDMDGNGGGKASEGGGGEDNQATFRDQCQRGDGGRWEGKEMETAQLEKAVEVPEVTDDVKGSSMSRIDSPKPDEDGKHGEVLELVVHKRMKVEQAQERSSSGEVVTGCPSQKKEDAGAGATTTGIHEETSAVSDPVHPLLIVDILENVFKYIVAQPEWSVVAKDVRNLRLVSKPWKGAVTPLYRRKRPPLDIDLRELFINQPAMMVDFLEAMKDSTMVPAQSYAIYFNCNEVEQRELVKTFLRVHGPEAVSLAFFFDCEGAVDENGGGAEDLSELNASKLKTLHVTLLAVNSRSHTHIVNFLQTVLNAAKELKEFEICGVPSKDDEFMQQIANAVHTALPATVKILKQQEFHPVNEQSLQKLMETGIQLKEFAFVKGFALDKVSFCKFMESQSGTLTTLKIVDDLRFGKPDIVSLEFPRMEELVELEFKNTILESLSFAETFPKVNTLNFEAWKREILLELLASVEKSKNAPSVKTLIMPSVWALPLKRMSDCFPNISELRIDSNEHTNNSIHEVFVFFTNVERLEIQFSRPGFMGINADAVLSGAPVAECKRISAFGNFVGVSLEQIQSGPSILNMTKLKKLVLKKKFRNDYVVVLSDFSTHFLFLRMTGLEEITTNHSSLSRQYEDLLGRQVKLCVTADDGPYRDTAELEEVEEDVDDYNNDYDDYWDWEDRWW